MVKFAIGLLPFTGPKIRIMFAADVASHEITPIYRI